MSRKTLLERLDDSVRWTGIPALAEGTPRRRPLRGLATLVLMLAVAGFGVAVAWDDARWGGYALLLAAFGLSSMLSIFGPLKPWGGREAVDERERAMRARAFLIAFTWLSAVAVIGLWMIVGLSIALGWSTDTLRWSAMNLAFLLATIYSAGPTCVASWADRAPPEED